MQRTIDRIEDGAAVCFGSDGMTTLVPMSSLPEDAREGDVIEEVGGRYIIRREDTDRRRETVSRLLEKIKHKQE